MESLKQQKGLIFKHENNIQSDFSKQTDLNLYNIHFQSQNLSNTATNMLYLVFELLLLKDFLLI